MKDQQKTTETNILQTIGLGVRIRKEQPARHGRGRCREKTHLGTTPFYCLR